MKWRTACNGKFAACAADKTATTGCLARYMVGASACLTSTVPGAKVDGTWPHTVCISQKMNTAAYIANKKARDLVACSLANGVSGTLAAKPTTTRSTVKAPASLASPLIALIAVVSYLL